MKDIPFFFSKEIIKSGEGKIKSYKRIADLIKTGSRKHANAGYLFHQNGTQKVHKYKETLVVYKWRNDIHWSCLFAFVSFISFL